MLETIPHLLPLLAATADAGLAERTVIGQRELRGQLSTRRYYRVTLSGETQPSSIIVMRLPDEAPNGPARLQAHSFVDVQRYFCAHDIPVPRIYAQDIEHGLLLLEDLSDETFEAHLRRSPESAWEEPYRRAIDLLARVHALPEHSHASESIALRRLYETELLRSELDHFREWGLEALSGPLPTTERAELDAHFDALTAKIVALPQGLVHRDFQSRNLMCPPDGRLVVLDFQDAFIGPAAYDLVALLCDSYVALNAELQESMLFRYAQQRDYTAAQLIELTRAFRLLTVQRKLKDAGRFIFIDRVRQNPSFLQYYPGSLAYVARALRELPDLAELQSFLRRHVASFPTS